MSKLFRHYVLAQAGEFYQAGPDLEKALEPVLVFTRGTTNLFEVVERKYFEHFGRTISQPDMQVGCLSGLGKLLCIFYNECET